MFLSGACSYRSGLFLLYVEDSLCGNYDEVYLENAEITELINEKNPDI